MDFDISLHVKFKTKGLRDANMKIELAGLLLSHVRNRSKMAEI